MNSHGNFTTTVIVDGLEYELEVAYEFKVGGVELNISIDMVTRLKDGWDMDPEIFQHNLPREMMEELTEQCLAHHKQNI